jgi:hypothetical protein
VSLSAGLVVAAAVVGLSGQATHTFNDEIRSSAAEATARTAIDRLRADLQRAAFMSTGNITRDPRIAIAPGTPNVSATAKSNYPALARLAGIHLYAGGSQAATPLSKAQNEAPPGSSGGAAVPLNPDAVEIAGNMTANDQFVVRNIDPPNGSCQRIWLSVDSPPMYPIFAAGTPATNLQTTFQPIVSSTSGGTTTTHQYFVRVADDTGHFQYVVTCATATGMAAGTPPMPYIDVDAVNTPILTTQQTGTNGGVGGLGAGRITVNPVMIVRWELTNNPPAALAAALNPTGDPYKYDLIRSYVDAKGSVVAETTEVVAEYAVDLKLAFTVDSSTDTTGANATLPPTFTTLQFDDDTNNATWAPDVSTMTSPPYTYGPQRIRSTRVRLVTRTALADRSQNITPNPANPSTPGGSNEAFIMRYCLGTITTGDGGAQTLPDCTKYPTPFARARTFTTEVALPNQARMYYL